jgi:2-dehydropantoate 2-reductase
MVVNFAGNIISPGVVKMTFFHKPNYVGCVCKDHNCNCADELARMMTEGGLETETTGAIKKYAWRKTILVASLAPVSAILGMTMAEVMAWGETNKLVENLLREAIDVAKAVEFDYGEDFFDSCLNYLSTAGHHKPSMLIDMEDGLPTEIGYINGKIAHYAEEYNIPAVLNTSITNMVKAKERLQAEKGYVYR